MRLSILDGIRGHLLIGMFIAHLAFQPGMSNLLYVHHYSLIRLYDAEFFVTISGLLVGILTARKIGDNKYFSDFIKRRLFVIYKYYLLSAIPALAAASIQDGSVAPFSDILKFLLGIVFIQQGGIYSAILPIYFYCFLIMAACYLATRSFGWMAMLTASFAIYVAGQLIGVAGFFGLSSNFVVFNIATWQFLFSVAFLIGIHHQKFMNWFEVTSGQTKISLFILCVICFAYFKILGKNDLVQEWGTLTSRWLRFNLHPYYLIAIICVCAGFSLVMINTPRIFAPIAYILKWYFSLKLLRNVGTYSIQMFVLHVYLMAAFRHLMNDMGAGQKWALAVAFLVFYLAAPNIYVRFKSTRDLAPRRV